MSWDDRIITDQELSPYLDGAGSASLHARARALLRQQEATWPMLRESIAAMAEVRYKSLTVKKSEVLAQFNPKRIVSAVAKVDAATIKQRPCFLCVENLPPEEKGIAFQDDYVILCNPFPVLGDHLVISSRRHTPQAIAGNVGAMLDVTKELGAEWFTLYNGPRCGASAPDHLHFQACNAALLPIFSDLVKWERRRIGVQKTVAAFSLIDYRVDVLIAQSRDRASLIDWFDRALNRLAEVTRVSDEPMINLIARWDDDQWTVIVFPRGRHRPACYDAEGDAQLIVSPAAIDLAGVLIVPRLEHFTRITAHDVEQINNQVMLDRARFNAWIAG